MKRAEKDASESPSGAEGDEADEDEEEDDEADKEEQKKAAVKMCVGPVLASRCFRARALADWRMCGIVPTCARAHHCCSSSADIFSKSSKPDKAQTSWKAGEP